MNPGDVTAVILTRDEERNLPRALTSLPHGMQVLVLDALSDDGTAAFARASGAHVIERQWTDFVEARRFAIAQVETPWLLQIDADEALDDVLRDAIVAADGLADGYVVSRSTYFHGKPMRLWQGERLVRLVRTGRAQIKAAPAAGGEGPLHERMVCDGNVAELAGTLLHYSYEGRNDYRERFAKYTDIEARGMPPNLARLAASVAMIAPRFANNALRHGAALDGPRGWFVAWNSAIYPAVVAWKALRRARPTTGSR